MKKIKQRIDHCPKCGCTALTELENDSVCKRFRFPYRCKKCGFEGVQWFHLKFVKHTDSNDNDL